MVKKAEEKLVQRRVVSGKYYERRRVGDGIELIPHKAGDVVRVTEAQAQNFADILRPLVITDYINTGAEDTGEPVPSVSAAKNPESKTETDSKQPETGGSEDNHPKKVVIPQPNDPSTGAKTSKK